MKSLVLVAAAISLSGGVGFADTGELSESEATQVDALIDSARERIAALESEQAKLVAKLEAELGDGDRADAEKLNEKLSATRRAIDQIRIDLWFDLRDMLSKQQLERLDRQMGLRDLELGLVARSSGSSGTSASKSRSRLGRSEISKGISRIRGRVARCGHRHSYQGKLRAKMTIEPSGRVSRATVTGGSAPVNSCVRRAVRAARFARSQKGISVVYPFVIR